MLVHNSEILQAHRAALIDGMTREEVCQRFQGRIVFLARRLAARLPAGSELNRDDLTSHGAIGLLEAIDRFDDTRKIQFSTYAEYRIRGAMMDALRACDTFSRHRRQMSRNLKQTAREMEGKLGRPPTPREVAERMGLTIEDYWDLQDRVAPVSHVSIDNAGASDGEDEGRTLAESLPDTEGDDAFRALLQQEGRDQIQQAIKSLSERKRTCVMLYYVRDMSLAEIAAVFKVTPSRICQILAGARKDLRRSLEGTVSPEDFRSTDE
jgi:RNA polymerase sigma factor for flagellar operon FliA